MKLEDVGNPSSFDPSTARTVLKPEGEGSDANDVKDPYIISVGRKLHMFYTGWDGAGERPHLAISSNGENWEKIPENPILSREGWHDCLTRVSCVFPQENGFTMI
ncbi:hypothetical protein AKJ63_01905 [candidate division MSBL1 archaeon SCGC-AAA259D18]|uniref:Glycosyl hydrolase family 32 N-terminal domain-containing protein n=1 Tax=candidate division MSBL1 archaeon SCGC-AAA259D18 TaxID=1698262 RepID=A0A133UA65_9EURY|nr:hypothetical protein AKJ63_01905 [candidate division MSBL1 archaeon SCGC-AAA259D18]